MPKLLAKVEGNGYLETKRKSWFHTWGTWLPFCGLLSRNLGTFVEFLVVVVLKFLEILDGSRWLPEPRNPQGHDELLAVLDNFFLIFFHSLFTFLY